MLISLLGQQWPAVILEALQTAAQMPAVSRGAGVSRARVIGNALRRAALNALQQRAQPSVMGGAPGQGSLLLPPQPPPADRNVRPRLQQSPNTAFRTAVAQHVSSGATLDDALRAAQQRAQGASLLAPLLPAPPPLLPQAAT